MLAYFARRVPTPELVADLMAETIAHGLIALQRPSAAIPDTPVGWLLTIAKNQLIDSVRRGKVESAGRRRLGLEPLVLDDHDIERILEIAEAADLRVSRATAHLRSAIGGSSA